MNLFHSLFSPAGTMNYFKRLLCGSALVFCLAAPAQTRLRLSTITPGTEQVQLVYNGDFQFQGPLITNNHPLPLGWDRQADMFVGTGVNLAPANNGIVARAFANNNAPVCKYERTISLQPNSAYVLSAYLWNLGDTANHVTTVIDMNDVSQEPQIVLNYNDANADQGYFVYRAFNTADTGSNVALRLFYDAFTGAGTAAPYAPVAAQWGNVAITKASDFVPPNSSVAGGNVRPFVRISNPGDGTNIIFSTFYPTLQIFASASDLDGTITQVNFYAETTLIGQKTSPPYSINWSNFSSGVYQLTAVAADNSGATTVSAPVSVSLAVPKEPATLTITPLSTNLRVAWPTSALAFNLQSSSNLNLTSGWRAVTNAPTISNAQYSVTLSNLGAQNFFRLGSIDPSSMNKKLLMGYQGWFACPNDGSAPNRWVHWFRSQVPVATNLTVDFWPDTSELDPDELFATGMTLSNGSPAKLYSAFKQKTVVRHFKWMKDYNLDGVFLQRFSSELSDPSFFALRNQVAANVRLGAETYGRVFAIMYDISGQPADSLISRLTNDWAYLVNTMKLTSSPRYLRHNGKPVLAIWGFGFADRPGTPQEAQTVINYFKSAGVTVLGGVPTYWRTLTADSQTDPAWAAVYRSFDVISPWAVGRYSTLAQADSFKQNLIVPDLAEANAYGRGYMPVIFPGFSWHNLLGGPLNQIPRNGGTFYWRQAFNAMAAGCTMVYGAMFDEVDEGTAMYKMAANSGESPVEGTFVPLNIDGQTLPRDWYLRIAGEASKMLRNEFPLRSTIPISP
jgi:hypothetical protein